MHILLKNAREQKSLKTREVANLLQIDQALISKFENGQRMPTRQQVEQLAELLEIEPELLIIAWLKEKIKHLISPESLGLRALQELSNELNPPQKDNKAVDLLFEEMQALQAKMEAFRNSQSS